MPPRLARCSIGAVTAAVVADSAREGRVPPSAGSGTR